MNYSYIRSYYHLPSHQGMVTDPHDQSLACWSGRGMQKAQLSRTMEIVMISRLRVFNESAQLALNILFRWLHIPWTLLVRHHAYILITIELWASSETKCRSLDKATKKDLIYCLVSSNKSINYEWRIFFSVYSRLLLQSLYSIYSIKYMNNNLLFFLFYQILKTAYSVYNLFK